MSPLVRWKLAFFVIGLTLWAWGYRTDDSYFHIAGIVALLVAFLLRFVGRRSRTPNPGNDGPPAP